MALKDTLNKIYGAVSREEEMPMIQGDYPPFPMPMMQGEDPSVPMPMMPRTPTLEQNMSPEKMKILEGIDLLQQELSMSQDPEEQKQLTNIINQSMARVNAPMGDIATSLASQGTDEDKILAHLTPNEVVLPEEFFDDPIFEGVIERKFAEFGIDPSLAIVGSGIASLNDVTGLQEFGFFKKTWKSVKKVAKKVAPIAAVIPGPWQPYAAVYMKGSSALKIAKGEGGIGDIMALASGGNQKLFGADGAFKSIASGGTGITSAASWGDAFKNIGKVDGAFNPLKYGINVAKSKASDLNQGLGGLFGGGGGSFNVNTGMMDYGKTGMPTSAYRIKPGDSLSKIAAQNNTTVEALQKANGLGSSTSIFAGRDLAIPNSGGLFGGILGGGGMGSSSGSRFSGLFGKDSVADKIFNVDPNKGTGPLSFLGGSGGGSGGGGGLFGGGLGSLAKLGVAGLAGKKLYDLAFDEAKNAKGVPQTPITSMDASGRYNIEAEIARRMGQATPNPVEYGLLPQGTIPQMSGGMAEGGAVYPNKGLEALAREAPEVVKRMGYMNGGPVMPMAYAEGGNVAVQDFERMNGQINGAGTETSDDVPAMLSDGEFVMTGKAVRGAGAYQMNNDSGIITLTPTGAEDRDRGTNLMYEMMGLFESSIA